MAGPCETALRCKAGEKQGTGRRAQGALAVGHDAPSMVSEVSAMLVAKMICARQTGQAGRQHPGAQAPSPLQAQEDDRACTRHTFLRMCLAAGAMALICRWWGSEE